MEYQHLRNISSMVYYVCENIENQTKDYEDSEIGKQIDKFNEHLSSFENLLED